jgi:hypothetical protein
VLEKLEEGETVEAEEEADQEEVINRYKLAVIVLGAVSAVAVLIILVMLIF